VNIGMRRRGREQGSLALSRLLLGQGYESEDFIGVLNGSRNFGIRTGIFR